ncbi:MAG: hypothetical protein NTV80_05200, partial [Verrucomicrobia bacterium]|nr:hypothetical protein [Verrucomicrobiota bacterium]
PDYHVLGDARRGSFYVATVAAGQLVRAPMIQTSEQALEEISKGGKWITLDAKAPALSAGIECFQPDACQLAKIVGRWTEEQITDHSKAVLEPIYLQEAFITIAKKVGKMVPQDIIVSSKVP